MRIALVALSGVRVKNEELVQLGVTLPGFVRRGRVIASLPSLGLLTVAGLTPPEHEVSYIEVEDVTTIGCELDDFDLVGISSFTAKINDAYRLADTLRGRGVTVVLGGLHVSAMPDEALAHADAIVVGGAEGAWPALLRDVERGALGRVYQGATNEVFSPSLYAMPRFSLLSGRAYNRVTVQTSRGCPRRNTYTRAATRARQRNFVRHKRAGPTPTARGRIQFDHAPSQSPEEPRQLIQLGRRERTADLVPTRERHSSAEQQLSGPACRLGVFSLAVVSI